MGLETVPTNWTKISSSHTNAHPVSPHIKSSITLMSKTLSLASGNTHDLFGFGGRRRFNPAPPSPRQLSVTCLATRCGHIPGTSSGAPLWARGHRSLTRMVAPVLVTSETPRPPSALCCPLLTTFPHLRPIHRWVAERLRLVQVCAKLPPAGGASGRGGERVHTGKARSLDFQEVSSRISRPHTLSQLRELATFPRRCESYKFTLTQDVSLHRLNVPYHQRSHLVTAHAFQRAEELKFFALLFMQTPHHAARGGATASG